MATVKLGLIQMSCAANPADNLTKAQDRIVEAAGRGAQIVCLQELFRSRYFCIEYAHENFNLAESVPGPTTLALSKLAREKSVVIIAPIFEKRADGVYHNSAVVIDADGSIAGTYRKMHIPDDPHFYEKFYFTPGDLGFRTFKTRYAKIGVLICWDQWFPEAARLAALGGAQILFYPTAIGWGEGETADVKPDQLDGWQTVQRGHAVANEVFVAVPNRVGKEGPITFWGNSFAADPFGKVIARADEKKEEILIVPCDLGKVEETRRHWPFLRDRRIDAYEPLTRRFIDETVHEPAPKKPRKAARPS